MRAQMSGFVYILASRKHGTLYTGVTSDLAKRIAEHRDSLVPGFTRKYGVKRLVWFEAYDDIADAILREKRIKEWRRQWKIDLIEGENPDWGDLAVQYFGMEAVAAREPRVQVPRRF